MALEKALPAIGGLHALVFRAPLVGEKLVRSASAAAAVAAFYAPMLGGKKCEDIEQLKTEWLKFLNRVGLSPQVIETGERSFVFEVAACPYAYKRPDQQGVCDAVMDLDRKYIEMLGGRMVIDQCIPGGSDRCRFTVSLVR